MGDSEQTNMKVIVFSLLLVGAVSAFRVKKVSPTEVRVKEGHPFKVICTTDNWYEWCTFKTNDKICEIEWKSDLYNVTMGQCEDYSGRVEFRGDYNQYECGLKISKARTEDAGEWSCELESFVKGGRRGDGYKAKKTFNVIVDVPTTTTTTTTTVTTQPDITDDYDYSYDDEPEEEVGETNEEVPASDAQNQNEEKTDDE